MKKICIRSACCLLNATAVKVLCCLAFVLLFSVSLKAQVTMGSDIAPAGGALLDLKEKAPDGNNVTATKGMVFPRVELVSVKELYPMYATTDATYNGPAKESLKKIHAGLTVYNATEHGDFTEGLYVWNGTAWRKVEDKMAIAPNITSLLRETAVLQPATYTAGQPYNGTLKIKYLGGNGGSYNGDATPVTVNGLVIEQYGGDLSVGSGELVYSVSGTPVNSSDNSVNVPLNFLGKTANVSIGGATLPSIGICELSGDNQEISGYLFTISNGTVQGGSTEANKLAFTPAISITESGNYSVAIRLYGSGIGNGGQPTMRSIFHVYLVSSNNSAPFDAKIVDTQSFTVGNYNGVASFTAMLGGYVEANKTLDIYIRKDTNGQNRVGGTAANWKLRTRTAPNPARTSLVWWKLN